MWISKERFLELKTIENARNAAPPGEEHHKTHSAQLRGIADAVQRLETNVGERMAMVERKMDGSARQATLSDILDRIAVLEQQLASWSTEAVGNAFCKGYDNGFSDALRPTKPMRRANGKRKGKRSQ
jgi:hypothetical protein